MSRSSRSQSSMAADNCQNPHRQRSRSSHGTERPSCGYDNHNFQARTYDESSSPPRNINKRRRRRSRSPPPSRPTSSVERETRRPRTTVTASTPPSHSHHHHTHRRESTSLSWRRVETEKLVRRRRLALVLDIDKTLAADDGDYYNTLFLEQLSTMYDLYSKNNDGRCQEEQRTAATEVRGFDSLRVERSVIVVLQDNPRSRHWGGRGGFLQNVVLINDFDNSRRQIGGSSSSSSSGGRLLVLSKMASVLKVIHRNFFAGEEDVDVRDVIGETRKSTLRGCRIVFNGLQVDPSKSTVEMNPLWKKAVSMGATCSTTVSDDVTHLVCFGSGWNVGDLKWALVNGKLIVGKQWLEAAFLTWSRPNEEFFSAHRS